jgi:ubiquinone biosynthesis protein UbiJ
MNKFEKQVISDLRDYKDELLKVVMAGAMEVIREKLKDVDTIQQTANDMKATEARLEVQIKSAMEKVEEVRGMADNVRSLNAKVDRLQYGQDQSDIRRKER